MNIFPLCIGTYGLGSDMVCSKDFHNFDFKNYTIPDIYESHKNAFLYSIEHGMNMFDASLDYGSGSGVAFLGKCLKDINISRDKYTIVAKLEKIDSPQDIEKEVNLYLEGLGIDYVDTLLLHSNGSTSIDLGETHHLMQKLVGNKIRNIGASNFSIEQTKHIQENVGIDLSYFEGVFNLDCKHYQENGFLDYCKNKNIDFTAYQPLRRNNIAKLNLKLLQGLSIKYGKSQNQIMLNWICKHIGISSLVRSSNIDHIKENIDSQQFTMAHEDYKLLDVYRNPIYMDEKIDRNRTGDGIRISHIANK